MIARLLRLAGHHARWCLVAGLVVGIGLPELSQFIRPQIPAIVAVMLFLAVLRLDPAQTSWRPRGLVRDGLAIAGLQIGVPLVVIAAALALGRGIETWAAVIVVAMAPSITASPSLCQLSGMAGGFALRLLVIGTLSLPLTAGLVLLLVPGLTGEADLVAAVVRLLALILAASVAGTLARRLLVARRVAVDATLIDGITALTVALFVVGLMEAIRPALIAAPQSVAAALALAAAFNFGAQAIGIAAVGLAGADRSWLEAALVAGNRNGALFLAAFPEAVTTPWLLFIGCYQIPMLLTPLVMGPLYRRVGRRPAGNSG